jgi:hypothetical protein
MFRAWRLWDPRMSPSQLASALMNSCGNAPIRLLAMSYASALTFGGTSTGRFDQLAQTGTPAGCVSVSSVPSLISTAPKLR